MNNITTLGLPINNSSKSIKIECQKTSAQCIPYFFSTIKDFSCSTEKESNSSKK